MQERDQASPQSTAVDVIDPQSTAAVNQASLQSTAVDIYDLPVTAAIDHASPESTALPAVDIYECSVVQAIQADGSLTNVYVIQLPGNVDFPSLLQTSQHPASAVDTLVSQDEPSPVDEMTIPAMQASEDKPKVYVKWSGNHNGRRMFDKKHYCVFCHKPCTNISKHLMKRHKDEEQVRKTTLLPKYSNERKMSLELIRNLGDYRHNCEVRQRGEGEIVPWRSPPEPVQAEDYVPCPDCFAFFLQQHLWHHHKDCSFCKHNDRKHAFRSLKSEAELLLPSTHEASSALKEKVFSMMYRDEFSILSRNDHTITKYGEKLYQKHGHNTHMHHHISCKMRELARLVITVRKIDPSVTWLADCLIPAKFDTVVRAVRELCGFVEGTNKYKTPSLALKLGHSLKKCCAIAACSSIKANDVEKRQLLDNFMYLCEKEWSTEVSSAALSTLTAEKMNKPQRLPLTGDIKKINELIANESKQWQEQLETAVSANAWQALAKVTLAGVVLFNRRRAGEAERLLLSEYNQRNRNVLAVEDVAESLSDSERVLCATMARVEIRGKRGRTVPVIMTPKMVKSIDLLNANREAVGIQADNPYVFARLSTSTPLRASDCIHKLATECGAECPENLTSTRLRKHIATTSQILNLQECELDLLAGFLGHDIHVHRNFYRLPQDTLQLAKISKLLIAYDRGQIAAFKGKNLDDIDINEEADMDEVEDDDDVADDNQLSQLQSSSEATLQASNDDSEEYTITQPHRSKRRHHTEETAHMEAEDEDTDVTEDDIQPSQRQRMRRRKRARVEDDSDTDELFDVKEADREMTKLAHRRLPSTKMGKHLIV